MKQKTKLTLLKFIAVSTAAYYLYHLTKAQGGTLQGRINAKKLAGLGAQLLPEQWRPTVREYGSELINQWITKDIPQ